MRLLHQHRLEACFEPLSSVKDLSNNVSQLQHSAPVASTPRPALTGLTCTIIYTTGGAEWGGRLSTGASREGLGGT